jgi:hypothetical protein
MMRKREDDGERSERRGGRSGERRPRREDSNEGAQ